MARRRKTGSEESLTDACRRHLVELVEDLHTSVKDDARVEKELRARHAAERAAQRTGLGWTEWQKDFLTQVGASWILACVFVRFLEDNELVDRPLIAGRTDPSDRMKDQLQQAKDAEADYYTRTPGHAERDWLRHVFRETARLPDMAALVGEEAMLWLVQPTADGGRALLSFFRELTGDGTDLRWSFVREELDTRFLGDLYQDLSVSARKKYALLQTPDFVEEFILERTLDPAIDTFGLADVRMIDPTCGSGHFLLGAFDRVLRRWREREPGTDIRTLVTRTLDAIHGVDINPFAAAIARFRLLVTAIRACGIKRLRDAPDFPLHVAIGDSLIDGARSQGPQGNHQRSFDPDDPSNRIFDRDEFAQANGILSRQYHAVVGNPPYITVKDPVLNDAYRKRYASCHRKYALTVPFMERFVDLAVRGDGGTPAGNIGKITANSFMKREFGKPLVEKFLPRWDLTTVIDTSGAYIPGHGTPTVILLLKNQSPSTPTVRSVLGIRGEPSTPAIPSKGIVWTSIQTNLDCPGVTDEFVSVEDRERTALTVHPWSLGGGAAGDVLAAIDECAVSALSERAESIGFASFPGLDDAFVMTSGAISRRHILSRWNRPFVTGDVVRDHAIRPTEHAIAPYDDDFELTSLDRRSALGISLWSVRTSLAGVVSFGGKTRGELLDPWWGWYRWVEEKYRTPLSIAFAFVATHNHFVLDRGGKVFKQSAPVIKLKPGATEEEHFELLSLLNSSLACFWMKQMFHNKGGGGIGGGIASEEWEQFREFESTKLGRFPLIRNPPSAIARELDVLSSVRARYSPKEAIAAGDSLSQLGAIKSEWNRLCHQSIAVQEELDWQVYRLYGLLEEDLTLGLEVPAIALGERAFEIVLARQAARGEATLEWFTRHRSSPITEVPNHWPEAYRSLVERRIAIIESDPFINLLERPEYKRRWQSEPWEELLEKALREALLDRMESLACWRDPHARPRTVAELVALLETDQRVVEMAQLLTKDDAPDLVKLLSDLAVSDAVPFAPSLYLNDEGLRKREEWLATWALQDIEDPYLDKQEATLTQLFGDSPANMAEARKMLARYRKTGKVNAGKGAQVADAKEDERRKAILVEHERIDADRRAAIGGTATPPVPPKYKKEDFRDTTGWNLRGALDVAKERFILYPDLSPAGDNSPLLGWAGWDHAQQAQALGGLLLTRLAEGWTKERLTPVLQGLDELIPWLRRWHRDTPMGDLSSYYEGIVTTKATELGLTMDEVRGWRPAARASRGRKVRAAEVLSEAD